MRSRFGFTSGDEMVRELAVADPPSAAIEGTTDQRMLERYGDLADPESEVSRLLASQPSFRLREDLGTGPRVYYLPPREEARE